MFIIPQNFVDTDYVLNFVTLKLPQPLQDLLYLNFCATKKLHGFREL